MKFNHLNVPQHWEQYWSKYPQGYTILEALIQWVQQVDNMVDNQNDLNGRVTQFREELNLFIEEFDPNLQKKVTNILTEWQNTGFLNDIINAALQSQMDEVDNRLTAENAGKVDKGGSGQIVYTNLSQQVREMFTGGAVPVTGADSVGISNIVDGSVIVDKLSNEFKEQTSNLMKVKSETSAGNVAVSLVNNRLTVNGTADVSNEIFLTVNDVYLKPGIYYLRMTKALVSNMQYQIDLFDSLGVKFNTQYPNTNTSFEITVTTAVTLSKLRVVIPPGGSSSFEGFIWLNQTNGVYEPPFRSKLILKQDLDSVKEELRTIDVHNLTEDMAAYLYDAGKFNLFNVSNEVVGKSMNSLGVETTDPLRSRSEHIDVRALAGTSKTLYFKQAPNGIIGNANAAFIALFDSAGNAVATSATQYTDVGNITIPAGIDSMVVSYPQTYKNFSITVGIPTQFNPYYTERTDTGEKGLGDTLMTYGDSQVEQNRWQPYVADHFGMINRPYGFGGYPLAQAQSKDGTEGYGLATEYNITQLIAKIGEYTPSILLVKGGTNDLSYDGVGTLSAVKADWNAVTIGTNEDTTATTYKGGLIKIMAAVKANFPELTVAIMSPIGGLTYEAGVNRTTQVKNGIGLTIADFAQAAEEVADYLGIPFIPVYNSGITVFNSATYLADGIHINADKGGRQVANVAIQGLRELVKEV